MLDGSFISPEHQIRVEKAEFKMKGDVFIPGKRKTARENASKRMTKRKIAMAQSQSRELCWDDAEEEELAGRAKLRIVILKPMFVLKEVQKSENLESFYDDLGKEVGLECEREAGSIEKLTVFEGSGEGAIAVKFKLATSAARCISVMNGRFFAGRKIECSYFDGTDYRVDKEETEQEREQRIAEFGKWLTKE
ncbi:hypothetical protein MHBO_004482 [Bonamia ostreae]|uniref:RRM domain-containing protein n=1 Tax=Bonamia ostreae TaxID=126728 RepID=A0ABV2ATF7_9EUKA